MIPLERVEDLETSIEATAYSISVVESSLAAAEAEIDRQLRAEILGNLPLHLATTLPLLYRGVWLDEFIVLSLPALLALCIWALYRRAWLVLLALSPGLFSLVFYPLFPLPITRYQMTTLPVLALATGWLVALVLDAVRRARDARGR